MNLQSAEGDIHLRQAGEVDIVRLHEASKKDRRVKAMLASFTTAHTMVEIEELRANVVLLRRSKALRPLDELGARNGWGQVEVG